MALGIKLLPETLRSIGFAAIGAGYTGIGPAFAHPIRIIHITNTTNELLVFSFDGINDHFVVPGDFFLLLDVTSNATVMAGQFSIGQGTRIYVKHPGAAPTVGSVYLAVFYGLEIS